ncbi:MAG: glycine zipper 2TM domain-containing protein [Proteobacteria bacterium]|nr:glycine zipper 2TM domain-containing protein [Pseudomonadota bacterium]
MKKFMIPAVLAAAVFSANAFAHGWDDDDDHCDRRYRHGGRPVVVYEQPQVVYQAPPAVYQAPPQVVYRERIVYRDRPVYYAQPQQEAYYPPQPAVAYPRYDGNRVVGQAVGALAGGVIGNQIGRGSGRVAATAVGAVLGSVVGSRMAGYPY